MEATKEETEQRMVSFRCTQCKSEIGKTNGKVLETASARLHLPGEVRCPDCGSFRFWRPARSK